MHNPNIDGYAINTDGGNIYNIRTWKQQKCPPTEEWIKTIWYMYTIDSGYNIGTCIQYYSVLKRNEIRSFVKKCVDWESVI